MQALRLTLLAAVLAVPAGARAAVSADNFQLHSATDLAALCSATTDDPLYTAARNFCEGFVEGSYRFILNEEAAGGEKTFCLPTPPPSRDQSVAGYVAFIAQRTATAPESAEDSVLDFLQHQYPCGGAK